MNSQFPTIKKLSRLEKIGQCFHPAAFIHDSPEGIAEIERYISEFKVGGLTFFYSRQSVETNFNRKKSIQTQQNSLERLSEKINRYQSLSETPLLISIDAEWGLGMRISSHPPFPYPMTLAATGDADLCYQVGKAIGQELNAMGIHMNLAPVVDVNTNPRNPVIGYRSFGSDPGQVAKFAGAYLDGLSSEGILGCLKHFPGHGDTHIDSHLELPVINKELNALQEEELVPFEALVQQGVDCVMTGHIHIPALDSLPASLTSNIINGKLRSDMGFQGVVMTDALNMKSVFSEENDGMLEYRAFSAGNDILSFSQHLPAAIEMINERATEERIDESLERIMALKSKAGNASGKVPVPDSYSLRYQVASRAVKSIKQEIEVSELGISQLVFVNKHPDNSNFTLSGCTSRMLNDVVDHGVNGSFKKSGHVLIVVFLPSDKPLGGSFGMEEAWLRDLHLLAREVPASLCLFGNPYALELFDLDSFQSVTLAYQDLPEFETAAANHFSRADKAIEHTQTRTML